MWNFLESFQRFVESWISSQRVYFFFFSFAIIATTTTSFINFLSYLFNQFFAQSIIVVQKSFIVFIKLLWRYVIEKYSSKSIDDKKLIFTKSNLIYWSEYWLFNVLQLTNIEIYLYFTIYEMNNFDVELDSYLSRFHVVRWISRNEILRESFSKTFVLKSFAHFMIRSLRVWAWSLNRRVRLTEDLLRLSSKLVWSERDDAMIKCDVLVLETRT
jgi:hypothetical protein